jgi:hypothetical protein
LLTVADKLQSPGAEARAPRRHAKNAVPYAVTVAAASIQGIGRATACRACDEKDTVLASPIPRERVKRERCALRLGNRPGGKSATAPATVSG